MSSKEKPVWEIPLDEINKQNKIRNACLEKEFKNWYCCPHCHKLLFPLREDTHIEHMPFRCKACKHDIEVNVGDTGCHGSI